MTNAYRLFFLVCSLALLLCGCGSSHRERLQQLETLEAFNIADSVMTNDSLAQVLCDYFDEHGTPNERMRAHYILGRTYADLGEAPAALEAYLDAAAAADTTAADCNYKTLNRVYGQSARLLHNNLQAMSQLEALRKAQAYAWKANDTLAALTYYGQIAEVYSLLKERDSVISIRQKTYHAFLSVNRKDKAALSLGPAITAAVENNDTALARHFIDIYERYSGVIDENGIIKNGRKIYYYIKGKYYLATNQLDSAEFLFRRLANEGTTLNHQIAYCVGLQEVYQRRSVSDSIAKYASMAYALNDSAYSLAEMENIQRLKASYDYNRNKNLAERNALSAKHTRIVLLLSIIIFVSTLLIIAYQFSLYRKRKSLQIIQYKNDLENLCQAQEQLMILRHGEKQDAEVVIDKLKEEVTLLQKRVSESHVEDDRSLSTIDSKIFDSEIVCHLRALLRENPPQKASFHDFKQIRNLINELIPSFYNCFSELTPSEYEICLLVRAHFAPAEICKLTGRSDSAVANIRKGILRKIYGVDGTPKTLDEKIHQIL